MKQLTRMQGKTARAAMVAMLALGLVVPAAVAADGDAPATPDAKFEWKWSNNVSWGMLYRIEDRDPAIIGLRNGGTAWSVNSDDGNLNYDKGIVSNAIKWTTELEFNYKDFGGFVRGFAFYDYTNSRTDRERTPLSQAAKDRVGSRAEVRDAFVRLKFNLGKAQSEVRAGWQVLNWGESTFIQGGINAINPLDVSALRVPGSELRDALLPVAAIRFSTKPSINTSIEAFYQFIWDETMIDPAGTYFSTSDIAGPGARKVLLQFGRVPDALEVTMPQPNAIGAVVARGADRKARDGGQYGAAFRWFVPALGETEFGAYYLNYHSRLPIISARTGTLAGVLGGNYAGSANYFIEYPEDIKLYGLSFNTSLGNTGIALQGEYSMRKDVPLQADDVELLYAALTPLRLLPLSPATGAAIAVGNLLTANNQFGGFSFGQEIRGYRRIDVDQFQLTATKVFSQLLGADQVTLVWEGAVTKADIPDKNVYRMEAPGTFTTPRVPPTQFPPGATPLTAVQPVVEPLDAFPDETSWGYVLAGRLDYNNAFGAVNMSPRFSFAHDVSGISPGPGGNFLEGRKALTLGVGFNYRIDWEWDIAYTRYWGAGRWNLLNDRDFISANIKYSF